MAHDAALVMIGLGVGLAIALVFVGLSTQTETLTETVTLVRENTVTSTVPTTVTNVVTSTVTSTMVQTVTDTATVEKTVTSTVTTTSMPEPRTVTRTIERTTTTTLTETITPAFIERSDSGVVENAWPGGWFMPSFVSMMTVYSYGYAILEWSSDQEVGWTIILSTKEGEVSIQSEVAREGKIVFPVMPTLEWGLITNLHNLGQENATVTYTLTLYEIQPSPEK